MTKEFQMTRQEAMEELSRYGIHGTQVYLIDIIPLIEMIWVDGQPREMEVAILDDYLNRHVAAINQQAGSEVLKMEDAQSFAARFLKEQPNQEMLRSIRLLIPRLRFSSAEPDTNKTLCEAILGACLDIASSTVSRYPFPLNERFTTAEKRCFFNLLESFGHWSEPSLREG